MLTFTLIDVQYLQNVAFGFEKGSNGRNHSSSGSHITAPLGKISPLPINAIQIIGWLVTSKHQKSGTKKAAFAAYLIHLSSIFVLTDVHTKPRNFVNVSLLNLQKFAKEVSVSVTCHEIQKLQWINLFVIYINIYVC